MKPPYDPAAARRLRVRRPRWSPYRYTRWRWHLLFAVIDAIGWTLLGPSKVAAAAHRRLFSSDAGRKRRDAEQIRAILVIQLDHLGDAVMSLALLRTLRQHYAAARIHVLAARWNDELFATCGCVDRVHMMETTRFARGGWGWIAEIVRWGRHLRRHRFDLAIDVRGEFPHAALMWLARARRRIGWPCGGGGFLLTDRVPYVPGRHEVLSRAAILQALGLKLEDEASGADESMTPRIEPTASALRWVDEQLAAAWPSATSHAERPLVALHVGAGTSAKQWPGEAWRELADRLIRGRGARIAIVGTDQDREVAQIAAAESPVSGGIPRLNLAGSLSLSKLAAVLRRADLFIGADSGPAHLAAAVGTPVFALFSGTNDPEQWKPWGRRVAIVRVDMVQSAPACSPCHRQACVWADHPCMRGIMPEQVAAAAMAMLRHVESSQTSRVGCAHQNTPAIPEAESAAIDANDAASRPAHPFWWAQPTLRWAQPALRWLLAGWMATVAGTYLWHMLARRGF